MSDNDKKADNTSSPNDTNDKEKKDALAKLAAELQQEETSSNSAPNKPSASATAYPPASSANKQQPAKSGRGVAWFALFVALISVAGAAGIAWYGYQQLQIDQQQRASHSELQKTLQNQLNNLRDSQKAQLAEQQRLAQQTQAALQQNMQSMKASITDDVSEQLKQLEGRRPNDWLIAEAHYLVQLASRKLYLEHDYATTFTLLTDAQARLTELADPSVISIKQAIAKDINQLQAINEVDTDQLYLKLDAWSQRVTQLPFATHKSIKEKAKQVKETEVAEQTFMQNLQQAWREIADIFYIRTTQHRGEVKLALSEQQVWLLQQKMGLSFQQAQLALLQQNQLVFESAIRSLITTTNQALAPNDKLTQTLLSDLNSLLGQDIQASLPIQLESLSALAALVNQRVIGKTRNLQSSPLSPTDRPSTNNEDAL
ncbi:uroporphyrinogen-III C-methyltransferase [Flocculibacter collagenilyticus]|uniref:uroporphyrinogen-III C-methyltransferase n=1 Tax=Flocculibacter collagenilyticus TaxID=2744479 RepID=UPI0018F3F826|nr:uroporphyrinogen-III C-methyltransferase [Flocculibacter collagenilyticus]